MASTISATNPLTTPATSKSASAATSTMTGAAQQQETQFLKLLVTQLKEQNPLDPQDGTQFVTQLAQFSSLEELVNIRSLLQQNSSQTGATASGPNLAFPTTSSSTSTNSSQGA